GMGFSGGMKLAFLELPTALEVDSFELERALRILGRIGALTLLLLFVCARGRAQAENSKVSADAAAANAAYSDGMLALQRQDLSGARKAFEKTIHLAPESPEP